MMSTLPALPRPHSARIGGKLTKQRCSDVAKELLNVLGDFEHVCCDLSEVEVIDVMGLQLLLAAQVRQRSKGRTLSYAALSVPVRELCATFGLNIENG
jgi:ABC-type transporter Mla MlaB component